MEDECVGTRTLVLSGDYGDTKAADRVRPIHRELNSIFEAYVSREYFRTIRTLSVVLRVSGAVTDFGGDGPERLEYLDEHKALSIDLVIPDYKWRAVTVGALRDAIAEGVRKCFAALVGAAKDRGELIRSELLQADFQSAIDAFERDRK